MFLLSTAPSERPHFAVVSYDTASFVLATLAMFTNGTEAKCQSCQTLAGEKQVGKLFSVLAVE